MCLLKVWLWLEDSVDSHVIMFLSHQVIAPNDIASCFYLTCEMCQYEFNCCCLMTLYFHGIRPCLWEHGTLIKQEHRRRYTPTLRVIFHRRIIVAVILTIKLVHWNIKRIQTLFTPNLCMKYEWIMHINESAGAMTLFIVTETLTFDSKTQTDQNPCNKY